MSVIKKYSATNWYCAGCEQLQKQLTTLDQSMQDMVESVDIDSLSRQELGSLKIRGVPVMIAFNDEGTEIGRLTGVPTGDSLSDFLTKYVT